MRHLRMCGNMPNTISDTIMLIRLRDVSCDLLVAAAFVGMLLIFSLFMSKSHATQVQ